MKNIPSLNEVFNLDPVPEEPALPVKLEDDKTYDVEDDYQLARQTMRKLLLKGESTLDELINLSKNSEHPRSYEVTGQMMKTLSDVSKDLLNLQKQLKDIEGPEKNNQAIGTQNNIVFAGSTHELLKILNKKDDGNTIDQ